MSRGRSLVASIVILLLVSAVAYGQVTSGTIISLLAALTSSMAVVRAAEEQAAYTDPEKAGPDFLVQGEYQGSLKNGKGIAAQVISLGNAKFEGVLYGGGLPGAGWDEKTRFHFKGETRGDTTHCVGIHGERLMFENPNFNGTIQDGVFRGQAEMFRNVAEDASFEMKKVHRRSPTLGAKPPPGAIVLFDGTNVDEWVNGKLVDGNLLDVGTETKRLFKSLQLHLEFRTPFMPTAQGMARGNSGIYVKKVWEIQIVDSFGWNTENRKFERLSDFGRCGGIHEFVKPRLNMCYPPLSWQTYDVEFTAAKFDDAGNKISPAMMTVRLNGIVIHEKFVLPPVPPDKDGKMTKESQPGPLFLQDHGNPVRFRNIWVVEKN